jgi:hypothetical protein
VKARGWIGMLCGVALFGACSGGPVRPTSPGWQFPASYQANQVVHVTTRDGVLDFLASVVQRGDIVEVVLFDPALQVALLRASASPEGATEERFLDGVPGGSGRQLAELIRTMGAARFGASGLDTLTAEGDGWRYTLSRMEGLPTCTFPLMILVEHRLGGPRIEVETTSVACGDPER